jgi:hypothetical protein
MGERKRRFARCVAIAPGCHIYIALAEAEGIRFVPADASLVLKVARQGPGRYADRVLRLTDTGTGQK